MTGFLSFGVAVVVIDRIAPTNLVDAVIVKKLDVVIRVIRKSSLFVVSNRAVVVSSTNGSAI